MRLSRSALSGGVLLGLLISSLPVLAAPEAPKFSSSSVQKDWQEGLAALSSGQFDEAAKQIHSVARAEASPQVLKIDEWVRGFEKLQDEREKRIKADYDKYVEWVKEEAAKGEWRSAIWHTGLAFNNAADQEAFRKEPWLLKTLDGASKAALEFEKDKKWVKAATIWVRLTEIFPQNKEYREALDRCNAHIRLEYTYTPDADWRAAVLDIQPEMARDAFKKIDAEYLTEPVFKDAVTAGLKQVLRLAEEPKVAKEFKSLAEKSSKEEFIRRIKAKLDQAQASEKLKLRDLLSYFDRVLEINEETGVLPENVLVYEFVQGALQPLDRFSDMIWPADLAEFNKHTQGRFSGVGISIRKDPGEPIKVVSPLEDTPAYRAGVQPNDMITKINGKPTNKYTINQAVREITGEPGTKVTLTFKRPGMDNEFDLQLERQEITIFTIKGFERDESGQWKYMIDADQKIGYVRMTNFTEGTIDELKDVIASLKKQGMRGLIFDLRGNPGGPLRSAVEVSDLFLPKGKRIVSTRDRHSNEWVSPFTGEEHYFDFPMIIIANRTSASASEIVTGALQVHGRALVVGERTFGKGSVQQVLRLNNANSAYLKLTTAHYYLPDNRCLHREEDSVTWGVDPDVDVRMVPKEIIQANMLRVKTDILKGVNQKNLSPDELKALTQLRSTTQPAKDGAKTKPATQHSDDEDSDDELENVREDKNEFPEIDPQLDASVMLMRVRLESNLDWAMRPSKIAAAGAEKK